MHIRLIYIILLLVACTALNAAAQVRGTVREAGGEALIGASVSWLGTNVGTVTDIDGHFNLHTLRNCHQLVVRYVGYQSDTVSVAAGADSLSISLRPQAGTLGEVVVEGAQRGNFTSIGGLNRVETISATGLTKMACCTVAESFENSASVTVGYSDAITGARQIKMLGLAGTYTQMLDESRPVMHGLAAPYGMTYTPGIWLKSIQVSKGVSSVTAGHEAITGQINLEFRKPTDEERLMVNAYVDDMLRPELNVATTLPLKRDKSLSTLIMAHGAIDTDWRKMSAMDRNHDRFRDQPADRQVNVANRWIWIAPSGLQLRWGWNVVADSRTGGMTHYKDRQTMRQAMIDDWQSNPTWGSHVANREAGAYVKVAVPVGSGVWDSNAKSERRSSVALVADFDHFNEQAYFGLNDYHGNQNAMNVDLKYLHHFSLHSSLAVGAQARLLWINEAAQVRTPWLQATPQQTLIMDRDEREGGAYAEYTLDLKDRFTLVAGVRGDHDDHFSRWLLTPRAHVKWNLTGSTVVRASAGMGYRTASVLADNMGMLTTGRQIVWQGGQGDFAGLDRMEKALTAGGSLTQTFTLGRDHNASLSFDYYRTRFYRQVVVDQEWSDQCINIASTHGRSHTDSYQVDFNWTPLTRIDVFATFRYTSSRMTLDRPDGSRARVERPLVSKFKTLVNVSWASKFRIWVVDFTAQLNGPARIPSQTGNLADARHSSTYPMLFAQVTHKVGRADVYAGCENITDYRQRVPVESASDPYRATFNAMNVWGPLMGRKFYVGVRFNLY